jgi:hypothetical protein
VLVKKFGNAGDYSYFSVKVECLFRNPVALTLEEYGLPMQIAEEIEQISPLGADLDAALAKLKKMPASSLGLHGFALSLFKDVQKYL